MLNVSAHFMVNHLRLNSSANGGLVYQSPLQKKMPVSAEEAKARQEHFFVGTAADSSNADQQQASSYSAQSVPMPAPRSENTAVTVFKMPDLSELPTRQQKALLAYQSVATHALSASLEIVGVDLYV